LSSLVQWFPLYGLNAFEPLSAVWNPRWRRHRNRTQSLQHTNRPDIVDTSQLHKPEEHRRQLVQPLWQDISVALVVCDGQCRLSYVNSQAECLLGLVAELVVGQRARSLFKLEVQDGDLLAQDRIEDLYRSQAGDASFEDCVLVRSDGQRLQVVCEIAAIGDGAILIVLRPGHGGIDRGSLAYRASHDGLTGLPNRFYLQERMENLHRSAQARRLPYSLLLLDLDRFKIVNDRFGHAAGDQVLAQVGRRIAHNVRELDTVGRWGGEEFLCLLPEVGRPMAEEIAERIRAGVDKHPIEFQGRQIRVALSIGIATCPDDGLRSDALLAKADAALYEAKRSGGNCIRSVVSKASNAFAVAHIIEKALREDRVQPAYQAVVNLGSGDVCGAAAVARIQFEDHEVMEAAYFIPVAERLHLVHRIDHRIIRGAVRRCASYSRSEESMIAMFVNFSADFLRHPELVEDIRETIGQHCAARGEDPDGVIPPLVIEITERQFMDDVAEARETLQPFLDMGVRIAIDDFGAGHSSLNYLVEVPVSFIKLEGTLVRRVAREMRVRSVLQGIHDMASDLGIITVAEGIEDAETTEVLREIGVDWGQGYYFSRPVFDP